MIVAGRCEAAVQALDRKHEKVNKYGSLNSKVSMQERTMLHPPRILISDLCTKRCRPSKRWVSATRTRQWNHSDRLSKQQPEFQIYNRSSAFAGIWTTVLLCPPNRIDDEQQLIRSTENTKPYLPPGCEGPSTLLFSTIKVNCPCVSMPTMHFDPKYLDSREVRPLSTLTDNSILAATEAADPSCHLGRKGCQTIETGHVFK